MSNQSSVDKKKRCVAISVSDSADSMYSHESLQNFVTDVTTNLLLIGKKIAYGGDFRRGGFSELIADTSYRQRGFARETSVIDQYIPYPMHRHITGEMLSLSKDNRVRLIKTAVEGKDNTNYLWTRSLSHMRTQMTIDTDARIIIGGKTTDYLGKAPGLIEEAKLALKNNKPLYIIGCFHGAARQVIQAIEGQNFTYTENDFHRTHEYIQFKYNYEKENQHEKISAKDDAKFFKEYGLDKLSKNNGLTPEENRILFYNQNPSEALFYLFKGLKRTCK